MVYYVKFRLNLQLLTQVIFFPAKTSLINPPLGQSLTTTGLFDIKKSFIVRLYNPYAKAQYFARGRMVDCVPYGASAINHLISCKILILSR